jgi:hypothetical protein
MNWFQKQFYALCDADMAPCLTHAGRQYEHVKTFKHDFFAATGLHRAEDNLVVIKIYRCRGFFGLPMRWLGKRMARHEKRLYRLLEKIEGIPEFLGLVGPTGFAHSYVPGGNLTVSDSVSDTFFDQLEQILDKIHRRGAAYVDLDKSQNVLLGDDGKPHLIDFQISYAPMSNLPGWKQVTQFFLRQLQTEDRYHFSKHKRRLRPDLLSPEDYAKTYQRSTLIRAHRLVSRPYFVLRHLAMDLFDLRAAE